MPSTSSKQQIVYFILPINYKLFIYPAIQGVQEMAENIQTRHPKSTRNSNIKPSTLQGERIPWTLYPISAYNYGSYAYQNKNGEGANSSSYYNTPSGATLCSFRSTSEYSDITMMAPNKALEQSSRSKQVERICTNCKVSTFCKWKGFVQIIKKATHIDVRIISLFFYLFYLLNYLFYLFTINCKN